MRPDEYLESVFKDAFKRELEVDENVARTLPFFAATLALVVTLYGYATTRLPPPQLKPLALLLYALLMFGAVCLAGVVYALFRAVRVREYRIPPKETEQLAWMESLRTYYTEQGLNDADLDDKVTSHLRARMIVEFAEGAEHNRQANVPKLKARAQGFTLLVAALAVAFLMIAIIFTTDRVGSAGHARDPHEQPPSKDRHAAANGRPSSAAPTAAQAPGSAGRREVPRRAGGEHGEQVSAPDKPPASGQPSQPPAKPAAAPPPPTHQLLKKSQDGGGPIKTR